MEEFIEAWKWIVERYKDDDTVIAVDLKMNLMESTPVRISPNGMIRMTRTTGREQLKSLPKKFLQSIQIF